jgi:hypothetical protein
MSNSYNDECEISQLITRIRDREDEERARADKYQNWYNVEINKIRWSEVVLGAILSPVILIFLYIIIYLISHSH